MYVNAVKLKTIFTRILLTIKIYIIIIFNYKLLKKNRTFILATYEGESSGMMMMTAVLQG